MQQINKIISNLLLILLMLMLSSCKPLAGIFNKSLTKDILSHKTYKKIPKPEQIEENPSNKQPHTPPPQTNNQNNIEIIPPYTKQEENKSKYYRAPNTKFKLPIQGRSQSILDMSGQCVSLRIFPNSSQYVFNIMEGEVIDVLNIPAKGYSVFVLSNDKTTTVGYGRLNDVKVKKGDKVKVYDKLGSIFSTKDNALVLCVQQSGITVDPRDYFEKNLENKAN